MHVMYAYAYSMVYITEPLLTATSLVYSGAVTLGIFSICQGTRLRRLVLVRMLALQRSAGTSKLISYDGLAT